MAVDKSKSVLTFAHPRITREDQELAGRRYFAGAEPQVLHVGNLPRLASDVSRATRDGDTIWLWALPMIVVRKSDAGASHHAQITLFCKACAVARAVIVEGSTGRSTAVRKETVAMINEAHSIVTHGGKRLPRRNVPAGRRRKQWPSPEVEVAARKMWRSRNIQSDAAAVRAIMDQWSDLLDAKGKPLVTERLVRGLGPSGRQR